MGTSLAERQRNMKMRTKGLPQPRLTRTAALDALAAQIAQLEDGPDKAALLARYLSVQGRRRITKVKHVTDRTKPEPPSEDTSPTDEGKFFEPYKILATLPDGTQREDNGEWIGLSVATCKAWQEANETTLGAVVGFVVPSDFVVDHVPYVSVRLLSAPSPEAMLKRRQSFQEYGVGRTF